MKKNNLKTFIIISSVLIVAILFGISLNNIIINNENYGFYSETNKEINNKLTNVSINENILKFNVGSDINSYCLKTTRSNPTSSSLCWLSTNNKNKIIITIIEGKKYYLWIKDNNNNISDTFVIKK